MSKLFFKHTMMCTLGSLIPRLNPMPAAPVQGMCTYSPARRSSSWWSASRTWRSATARCWAACRTARGGTSMRATARPLPCGVRHPCMGDAVPLQGALCECRP